MATPDPNSFESTCRHCQQVTARTFIVGDHGPQPEPRICPGCKHLLPLPPASVMVAYARSRTAETSS